MKELLISFFFRIWYSYINVADRSAMVTFMNYGYSDRNTTVGLEVDDRINRYSIQLYHLVASGIVLKGKDILEVGCGRGGGLSYVSRYLSPRSSAGIDLNKRSIDFCRQHYLNENIRFQHGNAEKLPFRDSLVDVVLNVESSHRYLHMEKFLQEVHRVLKPGGHLLFADFRHQNKLSKLDKQFAQANFVTERREIITPNVLEALKLSSPIRENLVQSLTPRWLHGLGKRFAATEGTPTFKNFLNREFEYIFFVLRKPLQP